MNAELLHAIIRKLITCAGAFFVSRGFLDAGTLNEQIINEVSGVLFIALSSWLTSRNHKRIKKTVKAQAVEIVKEATAPMTAAIIESEINKETK